MKERMSSDIGITLPCHPRRRPPHSSWPRPLMAVVSRLTTAQIPRDVTAKKRRRHAPEELGLARDDIVARSYP